MHLLRFSSRPLSTSSDVYKLWIKQSSPPATPTLSPLHRVRCVSYHFETWKIVQCENIISEKREGRRFCASKTRSHSRVFNKSEADESSERENEKRRGFRNSRKKRNACCSSREREKAHSIDIITITTLKNIQHKVYNITEQGRVYSLSHPEAESHPLAKLPHFTKP